MEDGTKCVAGAGPVFEPLAKFSMCASNHIHPLASAPGQEVSASSRMSLCLASPGTGGVLVTLVTNVLLVARGRLPHSAIIPLYASLLIWGTCLN